MMNDGNQHRNKLMNADISNFNDYFANPGQTPEHSNKKFDGNMQVRPATSIAISSAKNQNRFN